MKTNDTHESVSRITGRGLVLVGLLAVALAFAASSFAQSNAAPAPTAADAKAAPPMRAAANSPAAQAARAPRGTGEGIQVHGWWTIEVRNRDRSVAKHVEFENALTAGGQEILPLLLAGNTVSGAWYVYIEGNPSPCSSSSAAGAPVCVTTPPGSSVASNSGNFNCSATVGPVTSGTQPYCYSTLEYSLAPVGTLTLSGQVYADTSTSIAAVGTTLLTCGLGPGTWTGSTNTNSPSSCFPNWGASTQWPFSYYSFGQTGSCGVSGEPLCPIPVQAGQIISASVQFTFSSPSSQSPASDLARPRAILPAPNPAKLPVSTPETH